MLGSPDLKCHFKALWSDHKTKQIYDLNKIQLLSQSLATKEFSLSPFSIPGPIPLGPCPLSERKMCRPPIHPAGEGQSLPAGFSFLSPGRLNWSQADLERERLGFSPGEPTPIVTEELGNALGRASAYPLSAEMSSPSTHSPLQGTRAAQSHANQRAEAATTCPCALCHPCLVS